MEKAQLSDVSYITCRIWSTVEFVYEKHKGWSSWGVRLHVEAFVMRFGRHRCAADATAG